MSKLNTVLSFSVYIKRGYITVIITVCNDVRIRQLLYYTHACAGYCTLLLRTTSLTPPSTVVPEPRLEHLTAVERARVLYDLINESAVTETDGEEGEDDAAEPGLKQADRGRLPSQTL